MGTSARTAMIVRRWSAVAKPGMEDPYLAHFREQVMPELRAFAGFRGATVLTRPLPVGNEITVLTRWESLDAVRAFAGENIDRAVVAESVRNYFHTYDHTVAHHEVAFEAF